MTLVPYDSKSTDVARCSHCGNEVREACAKENVTKENVMPDMLFDPEQKSSADAQEAFEPPGAAVQPKASGKPVEKKPDAKVSGAKTKTMDDEAWESAPIGGGAAGKEGAAGNRSTKTARRKKNPAVELVKMAVGGILGLAIGYGILLYGFKVDPFNMARYLPDAMVPESVKTP